jgi:hypothetical protein
VVLPRHNWQGKLSHDLMLNRNRPWHKVRLSLAEDMNLKGMKWGLDELRGEFFIYRKDTGSTEPLVLYLDDVTLE